MRIFLLDMFMLNLWVFLQSFWRGYPLRFDDRVHLWKPPTLPRRLPGPQCMTPGRIIARAPMKEFFPIVIGFGNEL